MTSVDETVIWDDAEEEDNMDAAPFAQNPSEDPLNGRDSNGCTILYMACATNDTKAVERLLQYQVDVNVCSIEENYSAVRWAAIHGNEYAVSLLIAAKADINSADTWSTTPLHQASQNGHVQTMRLLVAAGANPNAANCDGETPLMWAAEGGKIEACEYLCSVSDYKMTNIWGMTALHIATNRFRHECVKILSRVNPNLLNDDQESALQMHLIGFGDACDNLSPGSKTLLETFLSNKDFDLDTRDKYGTRVAHLPPPAPNRGCKVCYNLLQQYLAARKAGNFSNIRKHSTNYHQTQTFAKTKMAKTNNNNQ